MTNRPLEPEEMLRALLRLARLGTIFCAIKDHDGARESYQRVLGPLPRRPAKGGVPDLAEHDPTRLNTLSPHPVCAWMGWAQILSPTAASFDDLRPLLADSLALVRHKWKRRAA